MDNWLFLLVVAFLALMGFFGLKKGFIKGVFSLVSLILTIVLTVIISPYVAEYLNKNTGIYDATSEKICEVIENAVLSMEEEAGDSMSIEELPIPEIIKDMLEKNNNEEAYDALGAESLSEYIGKYVAGMVVNAVAFIGTFIVIFLAMKIVVYVLDLISKLPIINGVNKLAGTALGVLEGFIILWILCVVVTASASTGWGQSLLTQINDNAFLSFIYNNNYLMRVVSDVLKIVI